MAENDLTIAPVDQAAIHVGARVRLRAPSPLLELRADTGTVVRPDVWDGYVIVRLDAPAALHHDAGPPEDVRDVAEAVDNLEPLGAEDPSPETW